MIKIHSLFIYPVKSLAGIELNESTLEVSGLPFDRNWMVVDESGNFQTQRNIPKMALIQPSLTERELVLQFGNSEIGVPFESACENTVSVTVWNDTVSAYDEGDEVSAWLTEILCEDGDRKYRLVRINSGALRPVDPDYLKGEKSTTAFSDGFPYLVASMNSINALNERLVIRGSQPVKINRFRPNIVLEGLEPFRENEIEYLSDGTGLFKIAMRKPCKRCVITTIDHLTGKIAEPKEPLRTLVEDFPIKGKHGAYFAQNAVVVEGEGTKISTGMELIIVG